MNKKLPLGIWYSFPLIEICKPQTPETQPPGVEDATYTIAHCYGIAFITKVWKPIMWNFYALNSQQEVSEIWTFSTIRFHPPMKRTNVVYQLWAFCASSISMDTWFMLLGFLITPNLLKEKEHLTRCFATSSGSSHFHIQWRSYPPERFCDFANNRSKSKTNASAASSYSKICVLCLYQ